MAPGASYKEKHVIQNEYKQRNTNLIPVDIIKAEHLGNKWLQTKI